MRFKLLIVLFVVLLAVGLSFTACDISSSTSITSTEDERNTDGNSSIIESKSNDISHTHIWGEWQIITDATCIRTGNKEHICSVCGETEQEVIEKKSHTEVIDVAIPASCTESGLTEGTHCSFCNTILTKQLVLPAQGHKLGDWIVVQPSTCSIRGEDKRYCIYCNYYENQTHNLMPHRYNENAMCVMCNNAHPSLSGMVFIQLEDDTYSLIGYTGVSKEIIIPRSYNNQIVSTIDINARSRTSNWLSITQVELPDSICHISSNTFSACQNLCFNIFDNCLYLGNATNQYLWLIKSKDANITSVNIHNDTIGIGAYAFEGCSQLVDVDIIEGILYLEDNIFNNCTDLLHVAFPTSVVYLGNSIFSGCKKLVFTQYEGSSYIGNDSNPYELLVSGKKEGDSTYTGINENTRFIYEGAFSFCDFSEVVIPDSVLSIGKSAFYHGYYSRLRIGKGLKIAKEDAFKSTYPSKVYYSGTITDWCKISFESYPIDSYGAENAQLFFGETLLGNQLVIPDGITHIGTRAFSNCKFLNTIIIPKSIRSVGAMAFPSVNTVYYEGSLSEWMDIRFYSNGLETINGNLGYRISSSPNCTEFYVNNCMVTNLIIPEGKQRIGDNTFSGKRCIKSISLPDSITSIGTRAFGECINVESISLNSNLDYIAGTAFYGCNKIVYNTLDGAHYLGNTQKPYLILIKTEQNISTCTIPNSTYYICDFAFAENSDLTSIKLGNGVKIVGNRAFYHCNKLTNITFPESTKSIGEEAFLHCYCLSSVTIHKNLKTIGKSAFSNCHALTKIDYLGSIAEWCDIIGLEYLMVYYSIAGYPDRELYLNGSLIQGHITIPNTVSNIPNQAFLKCKAIEEISFEEGITSIGARAFLGCTYLSAIHLPDSITVISDEAFYGCSLLSSIILPSNLSYVGEKAFYNCSNLTSISVIENNSAYYSVDNCLIQIADKKIILGSKTGIIPLDENIQSIGANAFSGNINLTHITIPSSIISIENNAFEGCYRLVEVYNYSSLPITAGTNDYGSVAQYAKKVYSDGFVSKLSLDKDGFLTYTDGDIVSLIAYYGVGKELIIPEGITEINQYAFYDNNELESIRIQKDVTYIGKCAFYSCRKLNSLTIGDSLMAIGDYAFYGCYSLMEISNKSTLSLTVGGYDNGYISYYAKAVFNNSDVYVSKIQLGQDNYLRYIEDNNVILIGYYGTDTILNIPMDITEIGYGAFYNCSNIVSVIIPDSVTSIGDYAFCNCNNLRSISLSENVTSIGTKAFYRCSMLTSVCCGDSITSIGSNAFEECRCLASVIIPATITSIGSNAFEDCLALTAIKYQSTINKWKSVPKENNWDYFCGPYTVYCTDGILSRNS